MRVLNDHKGDMDGRVALTSDDIWCLAIALELLNDQYPDLCADMGGDTLLPQIAALLRTQLDAHLLDLYKFKTYQN